MFCQHAAQQDDLLHFVLSLSLTIMFGIQLKYDIINNIQQLNNDKSKLNHRPITIDLSSSGFPLPVYRMPDLVEPNIQKLLYFLHFQFEEK